MSMRRNRRNAKKLQRSCNNYNKDTMSPADRQSTKTKMLISLKNNPLTNLSLRTMLTSCRVPFTLLQQRNPPSSNSFKIMSIEMNISLNSRILWLSRWIWRRANWHNSFTNSARNCTCIPATVSYSTICLICVKAWTATKNTRRPRMVAYGMSLTGTGR